MSTQNQKVAIVTGASGGIGTAVSERLARDDFTVVVNYSGSAAPAEALVRKIEGAGGRAISAQANVADAAAVARMFDAAEAAFGGVDVLINTAGTMDLATVADSDDALFDKTVATNLKGTFNTLREAGARMKDGGRIINFSTTALALNLPGYAIYNATKAAVEAFTHVFAKELRGRNITVNAVAPGPVATELFLHGNARSVFSL